MKNKTGGLTRVLNFFEERGFYIILFLCIGAIGLSGYVLFFEDNETPADTQENALIENYDTEESPEPPSDTPVIVDTPVEIPDEKPQPAGDVKTAKPPSVKVNNPVPIPKNEPFYVRPVAGTVMKPFSGDTLVKDETMGDWRVHKGVDFQALDGERVSAVADGTVEDIYFDEMLGYCIRIKQNDGMECLYCNLMKNATVKTGDAVKAGDIIGGVGNSMLSESAEAAHLHLEMMKDGKHIDPETLLPKK